MPPKRRSRYNSRRVRVLPFDGATTETEMEKASTARLRLGQIVIDIREAGSREQVALLEHEKEQLEKYIAGYKYPVALLPAEIVREIFLHFLPPYPQRSPLVGMHSAHVLGEVCGRWREISLGTPVLWATITVALHKNRILPHKLDLLKLFLARSKSHPLSIMFKVDDDVDPMPFARLLFDHSDRWEHVAIRIPARATLPASLDKGLPRLRSIDIQPDFDPLHDGSHFSSVHEVLLKAVETAHALERLHSRFSLLCDPLRFSLSHLTVLNVEYVYLDQMPIILRRTPNLVHCSIRALMNSTTVNINEAIQLAELQSLVLNYCPPLPEPIDISQFLSLLIIPSLRTLKLTLPNETATAINIVENIVEKSECRLQTLVIAALSPDGPPEDELQRRFRAAFPAVDHVAVGNNGKGMYGGGEGLFYGFAMDSYDPVEHDVGFLNISAFNEVDVL
ncbi:F-box domain-containing protein [Mycena indigotica]|uniref:F-box domain-containing protein n=1 Tax=Mycena indigotica TaxID=2126181 RepID=A0A8H6S6F5_9AGAR|nr:F-box domain-containing protein [Mycena indigotica]KAF7293070.1 F-box domain-containing protein [Mycena indigotica]